MALVTTKEMFRKAYAGGYAIGAFNVNNMEIVQGITEAKELSAPVILQVSAGARKYAKHVYLTKLVEAADPRQYITPARSFVKEVVKHKINNVLGCAGVAAEME